MQNSLYDCHNCRGKWRRVNYEQNLLPAIPTLKRLDSKTCQISPPTPSSHYSTSGMNNTAGNVSHGWHKADAIQVRSPNWRVFVVTATWCHSHQHQGQRPIKKIRTVIPRLLVLFTSNAAAPGCEIYSPTKREKIVWSFDMLAYLENLMMSSIKRKKQ